MVHRNLGLQPDCSSTRPCTGGHTPVELFGQYRCIYVFQSSSPNIAPQQHARRASKRGLLPYSPHKVRNITSYKGDYSRVSAYMVFGKVGGCVVVQDGNYGSYQRVDFHAADLVHLQIIANMTTFKHVSTFNSARLNETKISRFENLFGAR
jgi:hypothetical protein